MYIRSLNGIQEQSKNISAQQPLRNVHLSLKQIRTVIEMTLKSRFFKCNCHTLILNSSVEEFNDYSLQKILSQTLFNNILCFDFLALNIIHLDHYPCIMTPKTFSFDWALL